MGRHRGLGDTIAAITKATGIDKLAPAGCGCEKRQENLNKLVPYQKQMSEDHRREYERLRDRYFVKDGKEVQRVVFKGKQGDKDFLAMIDLYNAALGKNIKREGCKTCNANIYWDRLKLIFKQKPD